MKNKLVLLFIVLLAFGSLAHSADVPMNIQVRLMLKILSMDRNFARFGDPVKIGVTSDKFLKELNGVKGKMKIKGKDFIAEKLSAPGDIANYKVIYVGNDWSSQYTAASAAAAGSKALMFCQSEEGVMAGGGAISFKVVSNKPKIVINIGNVKKQGTDFPAGFLKITVVVGSMN